MTDALVEPTKIQPVDRKFVDRAASHIEAQFGCTFYYFDRDGCEQLAVPSGKRTAIEAPAWLSTLAQDPSLRTRISVQPVDELIQVLVIPVPRGSRLEFLALGVFTTRPTEAADHNTLVEWLGKNYSAASLRYCQTDLLWRFAQGALSNVADRQRLATRDAELEQMASQLTRNYEEITLLHQLTREAQVSQGANALQELTLSLLADLIGVPQVVFVGKPGTVLQHGDTLLGKDDCADLVRAIGARTKHNTLVENNLSQQPWGTDFDNVARVIAVRVADRNDKYGWLLALAGSSYPELGSVEASLMSAVAAILATYHTNVQLYSNIKDLFLGVVRALSSAIDAKDPYTCGHSERVARLARRIGQHMGLSDDECNRIYLSGLLHDVGKIGIRDAVLLKPGRLEPEERAHIQEHPRIGYEILSGVRQLRAVLAGVRNHHENFDGTGYPDKLKGEQIPMMARILAVADSYDAMSSDRPYRKGMAEPQVEQIFRDGMDQQWDRKVVEALLAIRADLKRKSSARAAMANSQTGTGDARGAPPAIDLGRVSRLINFTNE